LSGTRRAPDRTTWLGRRDHTLMLLAIQTGLRVSELTSLCVRDISLNTAAHVRVIGKGRTARSTTLTRETATARRQWLTERHGQPEDPLFSTSHGQPLSRDAVELLLTKHAATAAITCPSLTAKRVTPHALRQYVDGWVMWPAGVFPLVAGSFGPVPAT
jgi:site-specific recombinase XerC